VTQTAAATEEAQQGRSIVIPALLILIGVAVLIVLFRAAS
jgi:hypothetical protein